MKKWFFLLLIPLLGFVSCKSKLTEEVVDQFPDGTPKLVRYFNVEGQVKALAKEIQYYPNHNKFYEGEFRNNRKHGKWTVWYENGKMWSEGAYDEGLDDGARTGYYENGKKHFEGHYKKGKMVGTWKFYDEKGAIANETDYDK